MNGSWSTLKKLMWLRARGSTDRPSFTITWVDGDGNVLEIDTGIPFGTTPTYNGVTPTKSPTAQYIYTFSGWGPEVSPATTDRTYTAQFSTTLQTYTVYFYNDVTLLETVTGVPYGSTAVYTGSTPHNPSGGTFDGWSPEPVNIIADTSCYAQFVQASGVQIPTATSADGAYGVEWNYASSSSALTRKGLSESFIDPVPAASVNNVGSSPFDSIQPWAGMKRYNIINGAPAYSEDNPRFNEYLHDTVVYIPEFYYTAYKDTTNKKWLWAISPTPLTGFVKHPGSGRYLGRFHASGDSTEIYSKSNCDPLLSVNRTDFRTYAHNKGDRWYMLDLATWSALQMLYLVEFANFNSQSQLGKGSGNNSQKTGVTTGALYHTIRERMNINPYDDDQDDSNNGDYNSYRWVEQPFGRALNWVDGFLSVNRVVYTSINNTTMSDIASDLTATDITLPSSQYITGIAYSVFAPYAFIPDDASGGSNLSYVTDYVGSSVGTRALYVGGNVTGSDSCGLFFFYASEPATTTYVTLGSRLIYIP